MKNANQTLIVMADDDADDRLLAKEAFEETQFNNELIFVEDGAELMDYLNRQGKYKDTKARIPDLILLDLNMPKMDGREALQAIKSNCVFRKIPVIVMTTSRAEEDIAKTYDLGVNSFVSKPATFDGLVQTVRDLNNYWFNVVALPQWG